MNAADCKCYYLNTYPHTHTARLQLWHTHTTTLWKFTLTFGIFKRCFCNILRALCCHDDPCIATYAHTHPNTFHIYFDLISLLCNSNKSNQRKFCTNCEYKMSANAAAHRSGNSRDSVVVVVSVAAQCVTKSIVCK